MLELNCLLVPIDFSPGSHAAFDEAFGLVTGKGAVVIALHVIDVSLVEFVVANDLGKRKDVLHSLRTRAERDLVYGERQRDSIDTQAIVCEGIPFLEITKKAEEWQVDAIVTGKYGGGRKHEKLLFGTTAERVIRGSTRPMLVLPALPTAGSVSVSF